MSVIDVAGRVKTFLNECHVGDPFAIAASEDSGGHRPLRGVEEDESVRGCIASATRQDREMVTEELDPVYRILEPRQKVLSGSRARGRLVAGNQGRRVWLALAGAARFIGVVSLAAIRW